MANTAKDVVIHSMPTATLNVNVRVSKVFTWRMWVGLQLIRLAAWILPVNHNIEIETDHGDPS